MKINKAQQKGYAIIMGSLGLIIILILISNFSYVSYLDNISSYKTNESALRWAFFYNGSITLIGILIFSFIAFMFYKLGGLERDGK